MNGFSLKSTKKSYFWQSLLIALFLIGLVISVSLIIPDFMFGQGMRPDGMLNNFWNYLTIDMMRNPIIWNRAASVMFIIFFLIGNITSFFFLFWFTRSFILAFTYKKWIVRYSNLASQVINSVDLSQHNPKVAMTVYVCNDLTPSTILQTANQTFKKMDIWLLDDSKTPEAIEAVKKFAAEHNFKVCHRPDEHKKAHPTMIGNMFYFLGLHAKEYDFIFETGTSTITTNTFVENSLKYFYSPLINSGNVGAVSACGSFYPAKNIFSYIVTASLQWGDAHLNGTGFRTTGTQMYVNGWAAVYRSSVLSSIPLKDIECPSCDVARSYWMAQHGIDACFNPFDFSGKLNTQNIYRFNNQRLKWSGGDSFIFKKYWPLHYPDKKVNSFVKIQLFQVTISYVVGITCAVINAILMISSPSLFWAFLNLSALIMGAILGGAFGIFVIVALIIYRPNLRIIILTLLSTLFETAIIFKKSSRMLFVGLIMGRWSSKSVTIKTTEKMSFKQWVKICWFDFLILAIVIAVSVVLQFFWPGNKSFIWLSFFFLFGFPPLVWILSTIFSYIPYKKGWDDQMSTYDITKTDFRYKYIKETDVWKQQHPND